MGVPPSVPEVSLHPPLRLAGMIPLHQLTVTQPCVNSQNLVKRTQSNRL